MPLAQELLTIWHDPTYATRYRIAERITSSYAKHLIKQSGVISSKERPLVILDNGCGTGVVSGELHKMLDEDAKNSCQLTCGDLSETMLNVARSRIEEEAWKNAETKIVDAEKTNLPSSYYTHVFASFVLMALHNPLSAVDECFRMLKPGGTIAFSTWKKTGWMADVSDAIATMPGDLPVPTQKEFLEFMGNGQWDDEAWIKTQLKVRGFEGIQVTAIPEKISLDNAQQFVTTVSSMITVITSNLWTEEQRRESEENVPSAMLAFLERKYGKDQPIEMDWIGITTTARKPV